MTREYRTHQRPRTVGPRAAFRHLLLESLEDRRLLTVDLVSVTPPPGAFTAGDFTSVNPVISASGKYVAFQSRATNLVAGLSDANAADDVFVRNLETGTTIAISRLLGEGRTGNAPSFDPAISDNGRFVAFVSAATNLIKGVTVDSPTNVYVHDRDADSNGVFDEAGVGATVTRLLSFAADGSSGNGPSGGGTFPFLGDAVGRPVISGNGTSVAFASSASDLSLDDPAQTDLNGFARDVFRASTDGGRLTLISGNVDGTGSCTFAFGATSTNPSISGTGGVVAFQSNCDNIITASMGGVDDTNLASDIFIGSGGRPSLVSVSADGTGTGDGASREPAVSRDGRHVAFVSKASNLVKGVDANGFAEDVFVRDLKARTTTLVSRSRAIVTPLTTGNDDSPASATGGEFMGGPVISDSGRFVVFQSSASDLLDPAEGVLDTNGMPDLFVFDRDPDLDGVFDEASATRTILVSVNSAGTDSVTPPGGPCSSFAASVSGDGRYVAFASTCAGFIDGVTGANVYVRDLVAGTTALISSTSSGDAGGALATSAGRSTSMSRDGARVAFISDTLATDLDPSVTADPNGEFADVFVGTPPPDIRGGASKADGLLTGTVGYRVLFEPVGPFEIGVYRSIDATFDATDELLGALPFTDPDELDPFGGTRVYAIGTGLGEIAMPGLSGASAVETDGDYFILLVADHLDSVAEFDADPFAEDNTGFFSVAYHEPGGPVFIHGRQRATPAASGDKITVTSTATELTVSFGGAITGAFTYALTDVSGLRIRAHGGNDTVIGSDLPDFIHGGEGRDYIEGGGGDDIIYGGPGPDTIFGGPGFDIIYDGSGDDIIDVGPDGGIVMATPGSRDTFIGSDAADTIDFSLDDMAIIFDLDSLAEQTVDAALNSIRLVGQWENFVGSPFNDRVTLRPLDTPRTIIGGLGSDTLVIDAGGQLVVNDGTKFRFPNSGLGDIFYSGFEDVRVVNAAARIIDDGDPGYSANGFTRQFNPQFPQGVNGDIEFSGANTGNTASWTFNGLAPGHYAVSATWTSAPDRASSAPFTIRDGGPQGSIVSQLRVNQEQQPGEFEDAGVMWRNLDIVTISGNTLTVELTDVGADATANDAFEFVIADAIRIEPFGSGIANFPIIVDDAPNRATVGGVTPTIHEGTGPNTFSIINSVIAFQTALGGPDNGDTPGSQSSGARQVNWDNVGDASATPNLLPGNFFNTTFTRGLQLHTAGDGFQVSGTAQSLTGSKFSNLNSTYGTAFGELNAGRLFTPVGDNRIDVTFFVPGSNTPATVPGFGAVFTDVDTAFSSRVEFFDAAGEQLLSRFVQATPGNGSLSFLGVSFPDGAPIARVRITAGTGALLTTGSPNDVTQGGSSDLVALDDFIYGEPVPLPAPTPNAGFSSDCSAVSGRGFLGDQHTCSQGQEATWVPPLQQVFDGQYTVSATWLPDQSLSDNVRYEITDGITSIEAFVNQQLPINHFIDGGVLWERLATVNVVNGKLPKVTVSDPRGGAVVADAIRFDPAPRLYITDAFGNPVDDGVPFNLGNISIDPATGSATVEHPFTITNTGIAPLRIDDVQATGDGFAVDFGQSFTNVLPQGGSTKFEVTFDQAGIGAFVGMVSIDDDFEDDPFVFTLTANVVDDTTPPTIEIVSPNEGAPLIEGTSVPVHVNATDAVQLKSVDFLVDGNVVGSVSKAPFTFNVVLPTGATSAQLGATAHDVAGNRSNAALITVDLDSDQPPTVEIVRPFDGDGALEGSTIMVQVDVDDDVGVRDISVRLDSLPIDIQFFDPLVAQIQLPDGAGDHILEACVTDTLGHVTCDTAVVTTFKQPLIDFSSIVVAPDAGHPPVVKVFQADGTETFRFFAYDAGFMGGVRVAAGDVTGDGTPDIITGAGPGAGPHVKVFDGATGGQIRSFFAYDPGFRGGVFVAAGDVNGDGRNDIIAGAGPGGGPHVRVFDGVTGDLHANFFAFQPGFIGGVRVAAGDFNGDGQVDIITEADEGGGPHVRIFDGHSASQLPLDGTIPDGTILVDSFGFDPPAGASFTGLGGLSDGGLTGFIGAFASEENSVLKVSFNPNRQDRSFEAEFVAFSAMPESGSVRVAVGDFNNDGKHDIIAGATALGGPQVKAFDLTDPNSPVELFRFTAFEGFAGGIFVAGSVPPPFKVINLPPTGGNYEVEVIGDDVVVRQQGGGELFRGPKGDPKPVRINGAAGLNDILLVKTLGTTGPRIVFDGGLGGHDAVLVERRADQERMQYLQVRFENVLITGYSPTPDSDAQDAPFRAIDLEPIIDNLEVVDRVFTFPESSDDITFNTGDNPSDSILRIDSNHSEVVDFLQPSGSLTIESGPNDTINIGSGWVFDRTEVVDGKFARIFTRDGLTLRMIGPQDWNNPVNRFDVNANGSVEPLDVLLIINELNLSKFHDNAGRLANAASLPQFPNFFFDANRDGFVVPLDALLIINFLNSLSGELEGEANLSTPLVAYGPSYSHAPIFATRTELQPMAPNSVSQQEHRAVPGSAMSSWQQLPAASEQLTREEYARGLDTLIADLQVDALQDELWQSLAWD